MLAPSGLKPSKLDKLWSRLRDYHDHACPSSRLGCGLWVRRVHSPPSGDAPWKERIRCTFVLDCTLCICCFRIGFMVDREPSGESSSWGGTKSARQPRVSATAYLIAEPVTSPPASHLTRLIRVTSSRVAAWSCLVHFDIHIACSISISSHSCGFLLCLHTILTTFTS